VQHIEFIDIDHFENHYHRIPPPEPLSHFIEFFWETRFDELWNQYPTGFSDAQFANIGYTYILNLGTPFVMQISKKQFTMKTDGFLPRYNPIECHHQPGNHMFGIKFRISPVILEKKVDFSEYQDYIFPLSYLMDAAVLQDVKEADSFEERIAILSAYYTRLLDQHQGPMHPVHLVSDILEQAFQTNQFNTPIEQLAAGKGISSRTLQRYFETCTGISSKQALQIMRIRKATALLANSPGSFDHEQFGYYDHSHFYKHLRQFLENNTLAKHQQPHLELLKKWKQNSEIAVNG
jgi:AraC-like DNA-binding protein